MAGDWIKVECTTPDKPEICRIAETLSIDPDSVVGKCVRLWIWADAQSVDGNDIAVTEAFVDRLTFCKGFADALRKVGWLSGRESRLSIPNFERHNSHSAKRRAEATVRQSASRAIRNVEGVSQSVTSKNRKSLIPRGLRSAVFKRDGYRCRYCGRHKDDKPPVAGYLVGMTAMSLDHVIPESKGGATAIDNLVTACMACNQMKSGRTLDEAGMRFVTCHTNSVTSALPEREKRREEKSNKKEAQEADVADAPAADPKVSIPDCPSADIIAGFDAAFGAKSLLTAKRKSALAARWRDPWWRDNWSVALARGKASAFLQGSNDRNWKIDFEFFLKPDSVAKICEGKYDNRQGARSQSAAAIREERTGESFSALSRARERAGISVPAGDTNGIAASGGIAGSLVLHEKNTGIHKASD